MLVGPDGTVIARERGPVAPQSNQSALDSIFAVADRLLESAPAARARLAGIGAGAPGGVDWRRGVLTGATNLAWHDLPLGQALSDRYGCYAAVENDVNVAAWGERSLGHIIMSTVTSNSADAAPIDHLAFVTVGTGIGAGLIEDGRIVRGKRGAGEIGHIPLLDNGVLCKCGMSGCLEAVAAGPAFGAAGRDAAARGESPRLLELAGGDPAAVSAVHIIAAAQEGDSAAQRLLGREGHYLALAALICWRMLDPQLIVFGGGLSEAGPPLFDAIWANVRRLRPHGPDPATYILPSALGPDAGALGAAALILRPEPGFLAAGLVTH